MNTKLNRILAAALVLLLFAANLKANNITVSNISLTGENTTDKYVMVQFDLTWENSWRFSSGPANWDAAWVFVKYRVGTGNWQHAWLNDDGHTGTGATLEAGLQTPGAAFDPSPNPALGAFIYRSTDGVGTFSVTGAQLRWNYGDNGVAEDDTLDVKVFAIEMVYVPEGAFMVGSGGTESGSFTNGSWSSGATIPLSISSENAITIAHSSGNLWGTSSSGDNTIGVAGSLSADFPKGYAPFYCMKYEISQQQYVDFLNSLTQTQANNRKPTGTLNRYAITGSTVGSYATTNPYVACNNLSWMDGAAYSDWAGLRPMTELEFEKACRGTATPVANEYAWGTVTVANTAYTLSNSGQNNEGIATNYSTTAGNASYSTTDGSINGPLRVGIFAGHASNTGNITAGASYWGIMELSGNLWERPVTVGNPQGRTYTGAHGNGALSINGNANETDWPGLTSGEVTGATGSGFRGGGWVNTATFARVSDRSSAASASTSRNAAYGFRVVRSVPMVFEIGQSYGGGIIFYIDASGQHGLIAATEDQSNSAAWGCYMTEISGADSTAIGSGYQNTLDIEAGCSTLGIAARICNDLVLNGYSDWFLPSKDELNELYNNRAAVGGFTSNLYWSSTEYINSQYSAWVHGFDDGNQGSSDKSNFIYVRAVRAF